VFRTGRLFKNRHPRPVGTAAVWPLISSKRQPDGEGRYFSFDPSAWVRSEADSGHSPAPPPPPHQLIRDNLHLTARLAARSTAKAPRYCPSTKTRSCDFADKKATRSFREPEGRDTPSSMFKGSPPPAERLAAGAACVPCLGGALHHAARRLLPSTTTTYPHPVPALTADPNVAGLFTAGPTQWHHRLRGGAAQIGAGLKRRPADSHHPGAFPVRQHTIGILDRRSVTKDSTRALSLLTSRSEYALVLRGDNADRRL